MKERPILFSAPMVRAILAGAKTQTRRVVNPQPILVNNGRTYAWPDTPGSRASWDARIKNPACLLPSPYGAPGDVLWVRQPHYQFGYWEPVPGKRTKAGRMKWRFVPSIDTVLFFPPPGEVRKGRHHKDPGTPAWHKRLGRFMRRADSRLSLRIKSVRVERLQEISEADAIAEGVRSTFLPLAGASGTMVWHVEDYPTPNCSTSSAVDCYAGLWESINGTGSWAANPWVWVIEFERMEGGK